MWVREEYKNHRLLWYSPGSEGRWHLGPALVLCPVPLLVFQVSLLTGFLTCFSMQGTHIGNLIYVLLVPRLIMCLALSTLYKPQNILYDWPLWYWPLVCWGLHAQVPIAIFSWDSPVSPSCHCLHTPEDCPTHVTDFLCMLPENLMSFLIRTIWILLWSLNGWVQILTRISFIYFNNSDILFMVI